MDEIVFQRETLRRKLLEVVDLIDKAAESYDPEAKVPTGDFVAAFSAASMTEPQAYAEAVTHRVKTMNPEAAR